MSVDKDKYLTPSHRPILNGHHITYAASSAGSRHIVMPWGILFSPTVHVVAAKQGTYLNDSARRFVVVLFFLQNQNA